MSQPLTLTGNLSLSCLLTLDGAGGQGGSNYFLDNLGQPATAAYSVRRMRSAYAGGCMVVRRSSDNANQEFGFLLNGYLDTNSLTAFCGTSDGFVTVWRDQSGNGNDLTQNQAAQQPKIVNAGNLLTNGPMAYSSQALNAPMLLNYFPGPVTIWGSYMANSGDAQIFGNRSGASISGLNWLKTTGSNLVDCGNGTIPLQAGGPPSHTAQNNTVLCATGNGVKYNDSATGANGYITTNSIQNVEYPLFLFGDAGANEYATGSILECVVLPVDAFDAVVDALSSNAVQPLPATNSGSGFNQGGGN